MPTYVYRCDNCGHEFDQVEKMSADPQNQCPNCSKNDLKRVIQPAGGFRIYGQGVQNPTSRIG